MTTHSLKVWPLYFTAVIEGHKTFELRRDDRGFSLGDTLLLKEWDPTMGVYTGRHARREIGYIARDVPDFGLMPGFCIMAFKPLENDDE